MSLADFILLIIAGPFLYVTGVILALFLFVGLFVLINVVKDFLLNLIKK